MTGLGKYLRHFIAVVLAGIVTWLSDKLPFLETFITPEAVNAATEWAVGLLTGVGAILMTTLYAWLEKFLKRFPSLDPEGAADRVAIQEEARHRGFSA